jgi:tetratricopeptide (TPR) repeat protein
MIRVGRKFNHRQRIALEPRSHLGPASRSFKGALIGTGVLLIASASLLWAASVSGSSVSTSGQKDLATIAAEAEAAREGQRFQEAISLYRQALERDENWKEGWWSLGTIYYDLDRYEEGRTAFRRLVVLEPEAGPAWALLGLCEFQAREYDRALASLQKGRMLGLSANKSLKYVSDYHAALLLSRFEHFEASYEILNSLVREHHNNPNLIEALGISAVRLPFLPAELAPQRRDLVLRAGRAASYMATGRAEEAAVEYRRMVELYSDTPNVNYAFGVYLLGSEPDAALEHFRRELEISPRHVPAHLQIAFEYLKRGEPSSGLAYAEEAARIDPAFFPARNALGRILLELGEIDRAVQELEEGVRLAPESAEMRFALARAYARAGRAVDAERERAEFVRLDRIRRTQREGPQAVGGLIPPED